MQQDMREKEREMIELSLLEQQINQFEQQANILEKQIAELQVLQLSLDEIKKGKKEQEILSPLGKNIFVKTKLLSKEIFVGVGAKTVLKKNIEETKKIVNKEIAKLVEARDNLLKEIENIVKGIRGVRR